MSTLNHKNNLPIGFFDSGVGGLSVFTKFKKILPSENTIYFGDLKNLPYGNKTQTQLISFARDILDFFQSKSVKAVVIACNTSSAQAYDYIKTDYDFKIYPIIQSCAKVIAQKNYSKIGVFATQSTVNAKKYTKELKKYSADIKVQEIACPNWVNIIENSQIETEFAYNDIKKQMQLMMDFNPDKIILGCTHYPFLINKLKNFCYIEKFIDPSEIFVEYIKEDLQKQDLLNVENVSPSEKFFVSAKPNDFIKNAKLFYNVKEVKLYTK